MEDIILEDLKNVCSAFSQAQCEVWTENCIVALENNAHMPGCQLRVNGLAKRRFRINWSKVFKRNGYKEGRKITEKAAEAISFFLSKKLTDYELIEEAVLGTRIDYWLGYAEDHEEYDPLNFMRARMEISGIDKETIYNTIEKRLKEKEIQTNAGVDANMPTFLCVVELATPKASFVKI